MTSFVFWETLMTHLLLWGNAYAQIVRDGKNTVLGLYPLLPENVEVDRDESGELYYIYHAYTDEDVRKAIKEAERSGADLIAVTEKDAVKLMNLESVRNSKMPFYVLEIEMTIKGHQEEILEEQWEELL